MDFVPNFLSFSYPPPVDDGQTGFWGWNGQDDGIAERGTRHETVELFVSRRLLSAEKCLPKIKSDDCECRRHVRSYAIIKTDGVK